MQVALILSLCALTLYQLAIEKIQRITDFTSPHLSSGSSRSALTEFKREAYWLLRFLL